MPFPVDEKFIKEAEDKLKLRFPISFRNKMIGENGGEIIIDDEDWQLHPFLDKSDNKRISRTCNDIIKETESAREWTGFPQNAISIGENGYGDHIVFIKDGEKDELKPNVFFWNHETGEMNEIASDFSQFQE